MKRHLFLAALVLAGMTLSRQAAAQDRRGLVWDNRPSIVLGEDINIDLRGRVQFDTRRFDPEVGEDEFEVRTLRIGLKGDLTDHFDWEIEREIDEILEEGEVEPKWRFGQWKDVFVNWTTFDAFSVKGGRFKMPFGLEQNTGVSDLDFAYRSLGSVKIAPGRDTGVMAYGEHGGATGWLVGDELCGPGPVGVAVDGAADAVDERAQPAGGADLGRGHAFQLACHRRIRPMPTFVLTHR